jgi:hypothetical protein
MRRLEQAVPVLHCAKVRVDRLVVGDVVAHVYHWRGVDWGEPYDVYSEVFEVSEFGGYAIEVAFSGAGGVFEGLRVDLVDYC